MSMRQGAVGFIFVAALVAAGVLLTGATAFAGEPDPGWRPLYDLVMRWVNFLILAFIIVKFARAPLVNFLRGETDRVAADIRSLEAEKEKALERVRETEAMLAASTARFEKITRRIVAEGQSKKQAIIDDAARESELMIAEARRKIAARFLTARETYRSELVDMAISLAMERLAQVITDADNEKMTARFVKSIAAK